MFLTKIIIYRILKRNIFVELVSFSSADPGISKGGGRSRRGIIFRSGVCFDAPSHILYVFVARVVNKIHNINTVYLLKSKYKGVIQSRGGGLVLDPPIILVSSTGYHFRKYLKYFTNESSSWLFAVIQLKYCQ